MDARVMHEFSSIWIRLTLAGVIGRGFVVKMVEGEHLWDDRDKTRIDRAAREVELGYMVAPSARGRGVATEALRLLTAWAFEKLGAVRAELVISTENEASKRVAERCGYQREAVLRSVHQKQGLRDDVEIWSRLTTDA